ncbi:MAG: GAF and ANTAR domain-containing protein [Nocardioides sp.]
MTPVGEILMAMLGGVRSDASLPELLCQDACRRLPIGGAAIALMDRDGVIQLAVASDAATLELETLQLTLGEGPCAEAFSTGRLVLLPDLDAVPATRFPAYLPAVSEAGVRAIFSYPLSIGGIRLGVLDLYASEAGMLDDADLSAALHYVDAAVLILLHLHSLDELHGHEIDHSLGDGLLEVAFHTHPEIHQATGMVSVQASIGLTDALLLIRAHAFSEGRPLIEVARAVVSRTLRLTS